MRADDFSMHRRSLLKTAAAAAAATSLPAWFLEECRAQVAERRSTSMAPRVALVGCGGMGRNDARIASKFGAIQALCDVDEQHLADAKKEWPQARTYSDFRKVMADPGIDVVICGTVDHWHALVSTAAMRAGKDVYCEKPLTLTIEEGQRLVKVARETGRVLQTGSQQRSDPRFRLACELVRNGRIGKVERVDVYLPTGQREGPFAESAPPRGFDWDMWKGPTPDVPYVPQRTHVTFRYWWEYSGGTMTDWGAHHNDIALWGLGKERGGPVSVKGKALAEMIPGGYTAASEFDVEYVYDDGIVHHCRSTAANNWFGGVENQEGQQHGVRFTGSDGWIFVTRGPLEASDPDLLAQPLPATAERLYESNDHMENFFNCVKSRKPAICDAEIGHRSASICHLGVIAIRLGRELTWDPVAETFVGDDEATGMLARPMREPWSYETV